MPRRKSTCNRHNPQLAVVEVARLSEEMLDHNWVVRQDHRVSWGANSIFTLKPVQRLGPVMVPFRYAKALSFILVAASAGAKVCSRLARKRRGAHLS
jgi:hypothetical protein